MAKLNNKTPHILIVDDDPGLLATMSDILKMRGFEPLSAQTGKAALAHLEGHDFAVALIDLHLDDLFGMDVLSGIKARSPQTECILLTGHATQDSAIQAIQMHAFGYFQKPFDMEQVLLSIQRAVEKQQADNALRESEDKFHRLVVSSFDAIVMLDTAGLVALWNDAAAAMFGYTAEEMLGHDMHDFITLESARAAYHSAFARFKETGVCPILNAHIESSGLKKDGQIFPIEISVSPVRLQGNWCAAAIIRDITVRKQAEVALQQANEQLYIQLDEIGKLQSILHEQAVRDPLTGLHNRRYMQEALAQEYARAVREGYPISIIILDMDLLKEINNAYGHITGGDKALQVLGEHLKAMTRVEDITCRYGGDEFLIVLHNTPAQVAYGRAEQWRKSLAKIGIDYNDMKFNISFSAGVASFPASGKNIEDVILAADMALYQAKEMGRNCVVIHSA